MKQKYVSKSIVFIVDIYYKILATDVFANTKPQ